MDNLVKLSCHKIMQSTAYTLFVLEGKEKKFGIYTEPKVGLEIEHYLALEDPPRPKTHELLSNILKGLDVNLQHILIHDMQDSIYFAKLYLEHKNTDKQTILEIDARPSDCLTLAITHNIPIFCTDELLSKAPMID
jgi:bifunctional DNase/RNase